MFQVLGGVRAVTEAGDADLRGQPKRLLGILLEAGPESVATTVIIDRLWEGDAPPSARKAVNVIVGRLRRALEPDLVHTDRSQFVLTTRTGYRLNAGATDLDDYEALIARANECADRAPESALSYLDQALGCWARPWGAQADEVWLSPRVAVLEERHRRIEEWWAELALSDGRRSDIVERLHNAAAREPLRERCWVQLILALYRAGQQADALRTYERARALLRDELGIEPSRELRGLQLALLEQDDSLDLDRPETWETSSVTSFIGREEEMTRLVYEAARHRLVTVVGIGGIGKSRLVEEFAHRRRLAGEAVRRASFDTLTDGQRISEHLAMALRLDVDAETPNSTLDIIVAVLGLKPVVLVLDALENVTTEAGALIVSLIDRCPRLRIIATSRVPLGLPGERTMALEPLPIGSGESVRGTALELLIDRGGLTDSTFDDDVLARLERRCRATGGVPLLIELAAATATSLNDGLDVSASHDHVLAVHSAIQHAMSSVDERARELLVDAAVLPDGVSEETAELLCGLSPETARRGLRQLAWVHLFGTHSGLSSLRFRSLDPVREALLHAHAGDVADAAVNRAVGAVERVLTSVRPEDPLPIDVTRLDAAEDEHMNLQFLLADRLEHAPRRALELAIAASGYWPARGYGVQGRRWIEQIVGAAAPEGSLSWRATVALARVTRTFAEIADLRASLEQAACEMHAAGERSFCCVTALMYLAIARAWHGDRAGGLQALDEAKALNDDCGTSWSAERLDKLGALDRAFVGDLIGARDLQREHATRLLELDDPTGAAMSTYLAAALGDMAGRDDVVDDIHRARELATTTRDLSLLGRLLLLEARFLKRTGNPRSRALLADAAERLFELGGVRAAALARRDIGLVDIERGDIPEARSQLQYALPLLLQLDRPAAALATGGLAAIASVGGDPATARRLADGAMALRTTNAVESSDDAKLLASLTSDLRTPNGGAQSTLDDATLLELAGLT